MQQNAQAHAVQLGWLLSHGCVPGDGAPAFEFLVVHRAGEIVGAALVIGAGSVFLCRCEDSAALRLGRHLGRRSVIIGTVVGEYEATGQFWSGYAMPALRLRYDQSQRRLVLRSEDAGFRSSLSPVPALECDRKDILEGTLQMYVEETGLALSIAEIEAFERSVVLKTSQARCWILRTEAGELMFQASISLSAPRRGAA